MIENFRQFRVILLVLALGVAGNAFAKSEKAESLHQIPFNKVELNDNFWLPRLKIQKEVLVPFALQKTEFSVENLRRVGAYLKGEKVTERFEGRYYVASDLFKVMEGVAYLLMLEKDAALERKMDEIIDVIAAAQAADGYLYEHHILPENLRNLSNNSGAGRVPYSKISSSHELYNMGHMYEAAVAYFQATGKRKWLDVAEKNARHINKVFFEGDAAYNGGKPVMLAPGHEEIELALVKMYQVTNDKFYLDMAERFVDIRGEKRNARASYMQEHMPVREQREAVGHAVRATYLYSAMADIVAVKGDKTLLPALNAIWHDIVDRKMHITGGLGAVPGIEGFGPAYVLPNRDTYNETCSAIGNLLFNYRMFLMSKEAKYVDVAEVALYNNILAGVNLKGDKFFYVNPLQANGHKIFNHGCAGRSHWFSTACCPSNLARLIPQLSGMVYSHTDDDVYCSFYIGSSTEMALKGGNVKLRQTTDYPFDGKVTIDVEPVDKSAKFTLWMRIPSWLNEKFVPSEIYSYVDGKQPNYTLSVNGKAVQAEVVNGFVAVERKWRKGDKVELELPMQLRYTKAIEKVEADRNRLCITRGPLVLCAEEADNKHDVVGYFLSNGCASNSSIARFESGEMKGVPYFTVDASAIVEGGVEAEATLTLIPYYAWNNRGDNKCMNVWFACDAKTARDGMEKKPQHIASVKASYTYNGDDAYAVIDGAHPKSSHDTSILRWTSYRQQDVPQTIEIRLKKRQPIESVSVYWYDDNSKVRRPDIWSAEYLLNGEWREYRPYITDHFGIALNQFNMVHPAAPIEAEAIRLKVVPQRGCAIGILEVLVE